MCSLVALKDKTNLRIQEEEEEEKSERRTDGFCVYCITQITKMTGTINTSFENFLKFDCHSIFALENYGVFLSLPDSDSTLNWLSLAMRTSTVKLNSSQCNKLSAVECQSCSSSLISLVFLLLLQIRFFFLFLFS